MYLKRRNTADWANFVEIEMSANICALFWKQEYWKLVVYFPWPYRLIYCILRRCVRILLSKNDHFYLWMGFFRKNKIRVCSFVEVVLEWVVISQFEYPEQLSITTKLRSSLNKIVLSIKIKQQRTPGQLIRPFDLSRNRKFLSIYVFPNRKTLKKRKNALISFRKSVS